MAFRTLDMATWLRRDHFRLYQAIDFPYFSLTVEVDLTDWHQAHKASGRPFYPALIHEVARVANTLEAFRTRIRGDQVIVHDRIHPSFTVPWREELFNFCVVDYEPDLAAFLPRCQAAMAAAEAAEGLVLEGARRDDMVYLSCLPWMGFTGMTHPVDRASNDSIPRLAWGRLAERDGRAILPLNLQLHHGLADGRHVAEFVSRLAAGLTERV